MRKYLYQHGKVYYLFCTHNMQDSTQTSTHKLIAALWHRNQPQVLERLALLDQAATALLTPELRQQAHATAHKLAGSLGMFGFHEGTRLAREIEQHLESTTPDPSHIAILTIELRPTLFPST